MRRVVVIGRDIDAGVCVCVFVIMVAGRLRVREDTGDGAGVGIEGGTVVCTESMTVLVIGVCIGNTWTDDAVMEAYVCGSKGVRIRMVCLGITGVGGIGTGMDVCVWVGVGVLHVFEFEFEFVYASN
jgi:hypothetical protein